MDLAKYRNLFLEEATEHLGEMSHALLELERDPANAEAIDLVFRMAHSVKGMAASLGYDAITELAHRLEDRMDVFRAEGRMDGEGLALVFRGLEGLEGMVGVVRERGEPPPPNVELAAALGVDSTAEAPAEVPRKKAPPCG